MDRRVEKPAGWRNRRRLLAAAAILVVLVVFGALALVIPTSGTLIVNPSEIEVGEVVQGQFVDYLPLRAEAQPLHLVVVATATGGQVAKVMAADGTSVQVGEELARLVNPDVRSEVAQSEVEIASRLAELSAQELSIQRSRMDLAGQVAAADNERLGAEDELSKREYLFAKGIINDANIRTYRREAEFRRARVRDLARGQAAEGATANRQLAQTRQVRALLRANLDVARARLGDLVLRAPISGTLTGFTLQPGQTVAAGDAVAQVAEGRDYKLIAEVDEFYLRRVAPDQRATATIDGQAYRLVVLKALPQVTNGRFRIELSFVGAGPARLRIGQAIDVRLTLSGAQQAIVAPAGAWVDAGGTAFVSAASGPDRFDRRQVNLGRRTPEQVEILAGLKPGERLITSSTASYAEFNRVQVR
jgi:HlyD family secretion protein